MGSYGNRITTELLSNKLPNCHTIVLGYHNALSLCLFTYLKTWARLGSLNMLFHLCSQDPKTAIFIIMACNLKTQGLTTQSIPQNK